MFSMLSDDDKKSFLTTKVLNGEWSKQCVIDNVSSINNNIISAEIELNDEERNEYGLLNESVFVNIDRRDVYSVHVMEKNTSDINIIGTIVLIYSETRQPSIFVFKDKNIFKTFKEFITARSFC